MLSILISMLSSEEISALKRQALSAPIDDIRIYVAVQALANAGVREEVIEIIKIRIKEALRCDNNSNSTTFLLGSTLTSMGFLDFEYYADIWSSEGLPGIKWVVIQLAYSPHGKEAIDFIISRYDSADLDAKICIIRALQQNRQVDSGVFIAEAILKLPKGPRFSALHHFSRGPRISKDAVCILRGCKANDLSSEEIELVSSLRVRGINS